MRKQYGTVSFKGQVVYVGIDVHKKQWTVTIQHCGHAQKRFTMDPDPEKLAQHLKKNYPDAEYRSVYEAGFSGFEVYCTPLSYIVHCLFLWFDCFRDTIINH